MVKRRPEPPLALLEAWARGEHGSKLFTREAAGQLIPLDQPVEHNTGSELARILQIERETEATARSVRRWLEEAVAISTGQANTCGICGRAIAGRRDRVYCSVNCRVKAHRRRGELSLQPHDGEDG